MKLLSGIYQPDEGEIRFDGVPVHVRTLHDAQQLGISTVHQELNLIPHLDVGKNIYLGREPMRGRSGVIDWSALYSGARKQLRQLGIELDPHTPVARLGVATQQMTKIAKALVNDAHTLILDELTAAITAEEAEQLLLQLVEKLKAQGTGIILISHHLEDATRVGDCATVLRDGKYVDTLPMATSTPNDLIRLMVGRELVQQFPKEEIPFGRLRLLSSTSTAQACCGIFRSRCVRARNPRACGFIRLAQGAARWPVRSLNRQIDSGTIEALAPL
ncbi:MAG: ATP-binding cassette domain-containing protein [Thermomicrobiales bacterium]